MDAGYQTREQGTTAAGVAALLKETPGVDAGSIVGVTAGRDRRRSRYADQRTENDEGELTPARG